MSTSASLHRFNLPLLRHLAQHTVVGQWQYDQTPDEANSVDTAITLLHDYLGRYDRPLHLVGHGFSGLLGLLYARQYPNQVRSLTLLSVGARPMADWVAHYYFHRHLLNCSRTDVLRQMVVDLFGQQPSLTTQMLANVLQQSLDQDLSLHSLWQTPCLAPGAAPIPVLICGAQDDLVVDTHAIQSWKPWLKPQDRLWQCPRGYHFFHCFYPQQVGAVVLNFWHNTELVARQVSVL
uniref:alpha/beta fold hydrolase n=1 Tax=Petrachloros mirabilis TaxID=2918835 RepID=UPI001EE81A87|nr:alpha/beta hydrolase [Petrachloros mirabilis]